MNEILRKTHAKTNINILKCRDYYFDKARIANNSWKKKCLLAPIVVSIAGMFLMSVVDLINIDSISNFFLVAFVREWLDIIVGVIAIAGFIASCFIQNYIDRILAKSNELREWYDCRVLDIEPNEYFCCHDESDMGEYLTHAAEMPDRSKYEVWYRETFSEDKFGNAISMMMDNVIYTYYVYKAYRKRTNKVLAAYAVFFILYTAFYMFESLSNNLVLINPLILFMAIFDEIKELIGISGTAADLEDSNLKLKNYITSNADKIKASPNKGQLLREIEDVVISNRAKSLFIPLAVREEFLSNDCIYYRDLDEVKNLFWGEDAAKPEKAEEFEIPVPLEKDETETEYVTMADIHTKLLEMLLDVKAVLDEAHVPYMLDGGTLIGAMREGNNNSFLAWDDDVDISIKSEDAERAMKVIADNLGDKYNLQDYYSEKYYSPRLSRFRVRQKNDESFIDEKDSELYVMYEHRGLFLDIYAYSPILVGVKFDKMYRRLFLHPIHRKIRAVETACIYGKKQDTSLKKFLKIKARYMKRAEWYKKHAHCTEYYSYEPNYVEKYSMPGPYIKGTDLYGQQEKHGMFEGSMHGIPQNPDAVLKAFYGPDWQISPMKPLKELKEQYGVHAFSKDSFDATNYKHVKSVWIKK